MQRALTVSPSMNGIFRNPLTALLKLRDLEVVSSFAFSSSSTRKALDASILVVFESDDLELMRKDSFGTSTWVEMRDLYIIFLGPLMAMK